jgi:DUF1009 family protein
MDVFRRSKETIEINPFNFDEIEREFKNRDIKRIFFTGDFPRDRFIQVRLRQRFWGNLDGIADEKGRAYFNATPPNLSHPVRYFLALSNLLHDIGARPLLAHEIFPDLNVQTGHASMRQAPAEILDRLPEIIMRVATKMRSDTHEHLRFAQAAIVDNGSPIDIEATGTDDLLERYRNHSDKRMPFMLKLPSIEFNPALDQPTIGPRTVDRCAAAKIHGIVICSETTTIVSRQTTIDQINQAGMFLYAVPFSQLKQIYVQCFPETWARNASIVDPRQ